MRLCAFAFNSGCGQPRSEIKRLYSQAVLPNNSLMLTNRWPFAAALLLLCGRVAGLAENEGTKLPAELPFIVDKWESGPGDQRLPQSSVIAVTQTRDGYLWLGTLNGLVR